MEQNDCQKMINENLRISDMLFLEYAVKRCAMTLSKEEILSCAERVLTASAEQPNNENLLESQDEADSLQTAVEADLCLPAEDSSEEDTSSLSARSRDAPVEMSSVLSQNQQNPKKKKTLFGDLLFYAVLIVLIVGTVILTGSGKDGPRAFAGFTAQTVLTSSMESVYPKGALVISRHVDPNTLEIGDDITFMTSETTTITHRIIGIVENYADTGQRAFQTQGVMNQTPDSQLVPAVNVVGKVVFHSYAAGKVVDFLKGSWPLLLFFLVVLAVLVRVLKYIYRKDDGNSDGSEKQKKPKLKRDNPITRRFSLKTKTIRRNAQQ